MSPLTLPDYYVKYIFTRLKWTINILSDKRPVDLLRIPGSADFAVLESPQNPERSHVVILKQVILMKNVRILTSNIPALDR